jgi:protein-S-isoprenylcysteine O-methyltransferase Ste14
MKIKHPINLHKGTTALFVVALMVMYQNFAPAAWVYLALHGSYGMMWLLKDQIYPDRKWEEEIGIGLGVIWIAPWLLISQRTEPSVIWITMAIVLNLFGVFLHYGSDAQKYFTLKYKSGLISDGFFARCRNPNYLGEIFIYSSFAILAQHWLPFVILSAFVVGVFIPNMRKKDLSLARYPEFEAYKSRSGLLFPKVFGRYQEAANSDSQLRSEDL